MTLILLPSQASFARRLVGLLGLFFLLMRKQELLDRLESLALKACERESCQLYDLEFITGSKGKGRVLRVFIDKKSDGGASIADCANVSHALSALLDVEDFVPGEKYSLEVSTPGLERPLKRLWHFEAVVGQKVEIQTARALESLGEIPTLKKRRNFKGQLTGVDGEKIVISIEGQSVRIELSQITRAKSIYSFDELKQTMKQKKQGLH